MTIEENALMVPDAANVPAYIRDPEAAKVANEEAAAGISTGFPARIKLSGKQFTLVDGNGEETPFPPAKMVPGPDGNVYLPVIILRAKKSLTKTWYAKAYNQEAEAAAPDCFSNDCERPDPGSLAAQSDTCATCSLNAYGSGTDQDGNATKGKACSDTKLLAAFVPSHGIHSFKITPASLKNFGLYVKQLSSAGIPLGNVKTLVGFDLTATYPVLVFQFGGYVGEEVLPKLAELAASTETEEAIGGITVSTSAPAAPAEKEIPEKTESAPKEAPADDLGLGTAAIEATVQDTVPAQQEVPKETAATGAAPTDAELMDSLGL